MNPERLDISKKFFKQLDFDFLISNFNPDIFKGIILPMDENEKNL